MEAYFAFTDECGNYQKVRSDKFNIAHPFYTRSTVIISLDDYIKLEKGIENIKSSFGLNQNAEVKWAHYGSALKKNYKNVPHHLTSTQLNEYYVQILTLLCELKSVTIYYTLTENKAIGKINEISLLKMHLQNALQRVQTTVLERDGFAVVIADDLNDKTKSLKQVVYDLTLSGDYVQYTNIKKGLYIDFSDQCPGLQIADICVGVFTAALKYESSSPTERHKYKIGHDLFFSYAYKKTRNNSFWPPMYDVYKFGVKEVPNGAGALIAKKISQRVAEQLEEDLKREAAEMFHSSNE